MVCRECGAYNADHLTHCRVCAANMRDDIAPVIDATAESAPVATKKDSDDHPSRDFVTAPNWPKSAYAGAPENPPLKVAAPPVPAPLSQRPVSEPATRRACPHCGKATLADAPFCAYCGEKLSSSTPKPSGKIPVRQQSVPVDGYDDEDVDDDFDDDDDKPAGKRKQIARRTDFDDDDDDDYDDEEYDDEEYDDEDYDDEEYDDLPRKRGKGTAILFWSLIVILIVVIGICGKVIADRNFDGDYRKMLASIGALFGREQPPATNDIPEENLPESDAGMYTATITPYLDEAGNRWYDLNVTAPTGSTVKIISSAPLDMDSATVPNFNNVILRVPEEAFLPNTPCESETLTIMPNIQVTTPEGFSMPVTVEPIILTVPVLTLTLESPTEDVIQASYNGEPIVITGVVGPASELDTTLEVYVNGIQATVHDGGHFSHNYTTSLVPTVAPAPTTPAEPTEAAAPEDTGAADGIGETVVAADTDATISPEEAASDDTGTDIIVPSGNGETILIEVRKNNCVTAKQSIVVEPYVFQNMSLLISNDRATGLGSSTGTVTLVGTVTPGAEIKPSCDSDKVSFGEATVAATGNFSLPVNISTVGAYHVVLTATQEGYNETTTSSVVERPPSVDYKKFQSGASDMKNIIAKVLSGEAKSGDVYLTGTITEILGTNPLTEFKVKLADGNEIVCVNRSTKSKINSSDIKKRKQLFGTMFDYYNDPSAPPVVWVWYILNK